MPHTKTLIQGFQPMLPGTSELSPLDQYTVRLYMPVACLLQVDSPESRPAILRNLQHGLARTIDDVNFIAADLVPEPGNRDRMQLEFTQPSGVWFHSDEQDDESYSHLLETRMLLNNALIDRFVPEPKFHSHVRSPVLTVKATFVSGGMVLVMSPHHSILDAQGLGVITDLWAQHTTAESMGKVVPRHLKPDTEAIEPCLDWGANSYPREHFELYKTQGSNAYQDFQQQVTQLALTGDIDSLRKKVKVSHWLISARALETLKADATPPSAGLPNVTENNIVTAAIWQHISTARRLGAKECSSIFTTVNLRRRMEPPLSETYLRNVIVLSRARAITEELENTESPGSLYHLAKRVSDSIEWWNPERIWDFASSIDSWETTEGRIFPPIGLDVFVTTPAKMGELIWKSNWGQGLSTVKAVRSAVFAYLDGTSIVVPGPGGELDVMLYTSDDVLERLKEDQKWTSWARFLG